MTSLPRFSVQNPVLVNLFMVAMIVGGGYSALTMIREMLPESRPNRILITTAYPGATPSEVEKGITLKIEEVVKDVKGVEKILSTITEGHSTITAELRSGFADVDQAVNDIKAAIDTIPQEDFPDESKRSRVVKFQPRFPVISIALSGDFDARGFKSLGEQLRQQVLELPDVSDVVLSGTRRDEISIEVEPSKLVEFGFSFMEVGDAIARSNLDLPGGQLRARGENVSVRTLGEHDRAVDLLDIIIRSDLRGRVVRIRDVATAHDTFEDVDVVGRFNGASSVNVTVYKTAEQDAVRIAGAVRALVAGKMNRPLQRSAQQRVLALLTGNDELGVIYARALSDPFPPGVSVAVHTDLSRLIEGRLELLQRNGLWGLMLLTLSLLLFLNWRIALWVMTGLMLAVAGSLICMTWLGQTLNLMTMFGLIIVLGLLVDDAIIVAEHVYTKFEHGLVPRLAAITGAEEVTWPVLCCVVTTIIAFVPLMYIEGQIGDWMGVLPVVVCVALSVSLLEAFTVLPCHLAHALRPPPQRRAIVGGHEPNPLVRFAARFRAAQNRYLGVPLRSWYVRTLRRAVRHRYVTMSALVATLMVAVGAVAGGHVPFVFIPKMDAETLVVDLKMDVGTPIEETQRAAEVIERVTLSLPELKSVYTLLGLSVSKDGLASAPQSHLAQLFIELTVSEDRNRDSEAILSELRTRTRDILGVRKLTYSSIQGGPGGAAIHLEISGVSVDELAVVSRHIQDRLASFDGVQDLVDDWEAGRREVKIDLFDSARALGLTTESLATQVRAAFYGFEARKVQRGREDVKIMVRYPVEYRRRVYDIESMRIATPSGALVPFTEVARLTEGTGFASIRRKNQQRTVTITAEVDEHVTSSASIMAELAEDFPALAAQYPGLRLEYGGQQLETRRSFGSLKTGFAIALMLIYVVLAGLFRTYIQPMMVMAIIPFGLIGAVAGHFVMGYPLTILSLIGLVALTGIVVNDSTVLVVFINRRVADGADRFEAVIDGGTSRLRPILLTSVTTVLGIAPLLMERSFQAKFLIPMGISISAGLIFATVLTLVAIPSLYMIVNDIKLFVTGVPVTITKATTLAPS